MANWQIVVERTGRTYSVFGVTANVKDLLEGGFFSRGAAETARNAWERQCLQDEVEAAEKRAGWDGRA